MKKGREKVLLLKSPISYGVSGFFDFMNVLQKAYHRLPPVFLSGGRGWDVARSA